MGTTKRPPDGRGRLVKAAEVSGLVSSSACPYLSHSLLVAADLTVLVSTVAAPSDAVEPHGPVAGRRVGRDGYYLPAAVPADVLDVPAWRPASEQTKDSAVVAGFLLPEDAYSAAAGRYAAPQYSGALEFFPDLRY